VKIFEKALLEWDPSQKKHLYVCDRCGRPTYAPVSFFSRGTRVDFCEECYEEGVP